MKKTNILDEINQKILEFLTIDSKMTYNTMSEELRKQGLTISSVGIGKRVKKLVNKDLIHFTIQKNYTKLGFNNPMILLIQTQYLRLKDFVNVLSKMNSLKDSQVHKVLTISGPYTIGIYGIWQSKEEYGKWKARFINEFIDISKKDILIIDEIFIWDYYKE
ncbi:MAG: hypothetical protein ACFFDN_10115 [Candidatus Hodarchaeota archaeon]